MRRDLLCSMLLVLLIPENSGQLAQCPNDTAQVLTASLSTTQDSLNLVTSNDRSENPEVKSRNQAAQTEKNSDGISVVPMVQGKRVVGLSAQLTW